MNDSGARSDASAHVGLALLALIWGVNFSVIKVALVEIPPAAFNALRFPLASLVMFVFLRQTGGVRLPTRTDVPRIVLIGILGHVVYQFFFIFGIDATSAGNSSLLLATVPVWTTLFSVGAGHERPPLVVWLGVCGTVAGMALIVLGSASVSISAATWRGDALIIGSAVVWSLYTVGSRDLIARYGPMHVTAWTLWVGTVGLTLLGLPAVVATDLTGLSPAAWGALVYAGAFGISVAYGLWYRGVHRIGNARTSVYSNLVPVVALAVAWVWLGEVPVAAQLVGAAVVLVSVYLTRSRRRTA